MFDGPRVWVLRVYEVGGVEVRFPLCLSLRTMAAERWYLACKFVVRAAALSVP